MEDFTHTDLSISDITNDLRSSLDKGRLVAFIGAGISRSQDYPSWAGLVESMIHECNLNLDDKIHLDEYLGKGKYEAIAEHFKQKSSSQYNRFLVQKFKPQGNTVSELYKAIAKIPFHSFITTNYDPSLKLSLGLTDNKINIRMPDYSFDWTNIQQIQKTIKYSYRHILHAHGMWDDNEKKCAKSIILAESDYKELRRSALYKEYLSYIFKKFTVLFLGFGMQDWEIEWIDNLISEQIGSTNNLYVLTDNMPSMFLELNNKPKNNFKWISYECDKPDSLGHQNKIIDFLKILEPPVNPMQFPSSETSMSVNENSGANLITKTKIEYSIDAIKKAQAHDDIFILDTYAEYLTDLEPYLIQAIGLGASVKILFLERGCFSSQDRSRSLGLSDTYIDNMLLGCDRIIKRIAKKQMEFMSVWTRNGCKETEPGTIAYKTYSQSPTYSLICVSHSKDTPICYSAAFNPFTTGEMGMHSPFYEVLGDEHIMFYIKGFHLIWYGSSKKITLYEELQKPFSLETIVEHLGFLPFTENNLDRVIENFKPKKEELDKIITYAENRCDASKPYKKIDAYKYFRAERKQDDLDIFILYWPKSNKSNAPHYHFDTKGYMYLARGKTRHTIFKSKQIVQKYINGTNEDDEIFQEDLTQGKIIKLRKGLIHTKESLADHTISIHFYFPPLRKQKFYDKETSTWKIVTGDL